MFFSFIWKYIFKYDFEKKRILNIKQLIVLKMYFVK